MSVLSATILLVLIMNPLGNLPFFLSTLKLVDPKRHAHIIVRETFFAYLLLVVFMLFGQIFLRSIQITEQAMGISGGIILFIIAIRMIFPEEADQSEKQLTGEPFFVPLAIPMTAGPGALTTVMLFSTTQPEKKFVWILAITAAAIVVGTVLLGGRYLSKYLGDRGLLALEKLSGMMLTAMAVQMFLSGINDYFRLY
jgi:multiple antibiotic resistance protein